MLTEKRKHTMTGSYAQKSGDAVLNLRMPGSSSGPGWGPTLLLLGVAFREQKCSLSVGQDPQSSLIG